MDVSDVQLIEKFLPRDAQLAAVWQSQQSLEQRLATLENKSYLSADEQQERNSLKKQKLAGREQIETLLKKYRAEDAG